MISLIGMVYQEDIPEETRKSFEWFKIELSKKTIKKNEKYEERTITIYNLYRQECEIVNSLIIGIAHHIDFCIRGETITEEYRYSPYFPLERLYIQNDPFSPSPIQESW